MAGISLKQVAGWCDELLGQDRFTDYAGAVNGLQVENRGRVSKVVAAVDASLATVRMAVDAGADLMVVHHGLFWGRSHPWTGRRYELMRVLLDHDLAVYSSHLPLDAHPRIGNNAGLCSALGLKRPRPFFEVKGQLLGLRATGRIRLPELARRLGGATGSAPIIIPGGPEWCRRIGVVTGGAGAEVALAAAEGVDTFITGEGPHWTFALAEELGVNVLYGGHYATETFGVKGLAGALKRKFGLPWSFIDHPTGL